MSLYESNMFTYVSKKQEYFSLINNEKKVISPEIKHSNNLLSDFSNNSIINGVYKSNNYIPFNNISCKETREARDFSENKEIKLIHEMLNSQSSKK